MGVVTHNFLRGYLALYTRIQKTWLVPSYDVAYQGSLRLLHPVIHAESILLCGLGDRKLYTKALVLGDAMLQMANETARVHNPEPCPA
jgi:hypothetical protein